jgi:hypothetical protein
MHTYPKVFLDSSIESDRHPDSGCLCPPPRSRNSKLDLACMVFAAVTVASCAHQSERASSVASIYRTPQSAIETAFATLKASSIDDTLSSRPRAQNSCNDFDFRFLNSTCSKVHTKHAARIHRVATFVNGHPDTSQALTTAQLLSATVNVQKEIRFQEGESE